jgi:hypothetical protein
MFTPPFEVTRACAPRITGDPPAAGIVEIRMMLRRHFFGFAAAAVCTAPALAAVPPIPSRRLDFRIMRKGTRIGTHTLSFSQNGDSLTVDIAAEMAVSFGPIRLFHYNHHNIERWANGRFDSMLAKTDYDGDPAWCQVQRHGETLVVDGSKAASYEAASNVLPATHWNRAELAGPMINPENGMLLRPAIDDLGSDAVALASGRDVDATHYSWRGKNNLDLWYDARNEWAALHAETASGEVITYERL